MSLSLLYLNFQFIYLNNIIKLAGLNMNNKSIIITFLYFIAITVSFADNIGKNNEGDKLLGVWEIFDGETHFEVTKDKNNLYHGKIIWLKEPLNKKGKPKLDVENSDENLRNRPLIGIDFLSNFQYVGNNKWKKGTLYGFKRGKTLEPKLSLIDINTMKVEAEIFFFTKTFEWKRVK